MALYIMLVAILALAVAGCASIPIPSCIPIPNSIPTLGAFL